MQGEERERERGGNEAWDSATQEKKERWMLDSSGHHEHPDIFTKKMERM